VGLLARAVRVPLIIAYMLAGLVLGPLTGWVHATDSLELISEVGSRSSCSWWGWSCRWRRSGTWGRWRCWRGRRSWCVTGLLGGACRWLLGLGLVAALLALGLTFSSTVVVVKLLDRRGELDSTHGRIAVGILLVQDVAVVVALTLLAGLEDPRGRRGGRGAIGRGLREASVGMAALVVVAYVAVRFVLPPCSAGSARRWRRSSSGA
jgi:predicted Kef-type K+ transport protein